MAYPTSSRSNHPLRVSLGALLLLALAACGGPPQAQAPPGAEPKLGDAWFAFRAETLGIDPAAARARDAALPGKEGPPPTEQLDDHTAREAAVIWATRCAQCHGAQGEPPPAMVAQWEAAGQKAPRTWGGAARMGFAMGGDSMRAGLFRKISEGVPPGMPPWGGVLAQEQIWALIRHLEGF